jgi:hypothetical protein
MASPLIVVNKSLGIPLASTAIRGSAVGALLWDISRGGPLRQMHKSIHLFRQRIAGDLVSSQAASASLDIASSDLAARIVRRASGTLPIPSLNSEVAR